jgi:uncharacterized membrane protein
MGTRGGRPEPTAVTAGTARKNSQRGGKNAAARNAASSRLGSGSRPGSARPRTPAPAAVAPEEVSTGAPRWFQWVTLALAIVGLGLSIYLTYTHFTDSAPAACPENSTINCVKVTTSAQSYLFGIPVAVLGLAFYLFMVAVMTPWGWRLRLAAVHWARLVSVIIGIVFVLYLVYVEMFKVNAICLWCTGVHVVTFVLFVFTVFSAAAWGLRRPAGGPA